MAGPSEIGRKKNGDVRLDYSIGGVARVRTWEPRGPVALETTFRADGAVLLQTIVQTAKVKEKIEEIITDSGSARPVEVEYRDVVFDRACPWCGKHALVRFAEAYRGQGEVPIIPLYHCKECRGRSYYLTDEYLLHLIASNPDLFESADIERFKKDQGGFLTEIKAHVISSFASKKVKRID
jgi:hypothetical protein